MTTTQTPQHRAATEGPPHSYPLPLQLGYKATSQLGPLYGFGQIRVISSKYIVFAPGDELKPRMNAEIVVAWPRLLDGRVRLQLVLQVMITGSHEGVAEARILAYDFRTAGLAKVETEELSRPPYYENLSGPSPIPQPPRRPAKPVPAVDPKAETTG